MKKKIMSILLCVAMLSTLLAACGGKEDGGTTESKDGKTVLKMWTIATESDAFHNAYVKAIEEYEAAHPDVIIEMETFENQAYKTKIKSAVAANELPDIFFTWGGGFSKSFVDAGKVLPLDTYYEDFKDELSEAAVSYTTYDGTLYGTTYVASISALFYNRALFEEKGLEAPETWEDLIEVCKVLKADDITPIAMSAKDTWVLAMTHDGLVLKSAGHDKVQSALTKEGQSYNDPDFIAAADKVQELLDMGAFSEGATGLSNDEAQATFTTGGSAAMYIMGSWTGGVISTDAENPEDFDVVPIPVVSANAEATDFMGGAVDALMVNAETANPDIAANAAFELSRSVSKYAYLDEAGIAVWPKDYDVSSINPITAKLADYVDNATSFTLWFDTLMDAEDAGEYLALLQEFYAGNIDSQTFAERMDAQLSK